MKSKLILKNDKYTSNQIQAFTLKRNNKVKDFMHKASSYIRDYCLSNQIGTIVLGYNKGWKQEVNMGDNNNQKFCYIPFAKFRDMLEYKCKLVGINLIITNESYTSKCSFIDNESMRKKKTYLGNRKTRGLFISQNGIKINADINAGFNIIRKKFDILYNGNLKITPHRINLSGAVKDIRSNKNNKGSS